MIIGEDIFRLPSEAGVKILANEPFRAITATDDSGKIRRKPPLEILDPFSDCNSANNIVINDLVEPIDIFAAEIPNGVVVGERAVVTQSTEKKGWRRFIEKSSKCFLITDSSHPNYRSSIFQQEERRQFESVLLDAVDGGYRYSPSALPHVKLDHECVLLTAMEHGNYGAFLLRLIPKIILVKQLGLLGLPFLAPTWGWQGKVLRAFGVNLEHAISHERTHTYLTRKLIMPSMRTSDFFLDDCSRNFIQDVKDRICRAARNETKHELLYVSRLSQGRKNPNYRFFMNEQVLIDEMSSRGFHIFEPENHSFEEQVQTFASARVVVGPGGAGMFNTIFCRPGTTIISIEPILNWLSMHANMFASMGHEYAFVVGGADKNDPVVQKRWSTDIKCVTSLVDRLMR